MARRKKEIEYITLKEVVETYDKYSNEDSLYKMLTNLKVNNIKDEEGNIRYVKDEVEKIYKPYTV